MSRLWAFWTGRDLSSTFYLKGIQRWTVARVVLGSLTRKLVQPRMDDPPISVPNPRLRDPDDLQPEGPVVSPV